MRSVPLGDLAMHYLFLPRVFVIAATVSAMLVGMSPLSATAASGDLAPETGATTASCVFNMKGDRGHESYNYASGHGWWD